MPSWVLFIILVIIGVVATELGFLVGHRKVKKGINEPTAPIGTAVSAILALLAFMLGFTFSITSSRFADRKGLVISQANAIGAGYLRAGLLPEEQKTIVRKLFTEYIDLLLQLPEAKNVEVLLNRRDDIHLLLWEQALSLEEQDIPPAMKSLFINSVNDIISLAEERKTVALVFRIPDALWEALLFLNAISMFAYGYQKGISGSRRTFELPVLTITYAVVIVLIADMDSTSLRRFKVSQEPLKSLQKMIRKGPK